MIKLHTFFQLIIRDLTAYKREFFTHLFDTFLILFTNLIVFGYFMPELGLRDYGPFILVSAITAFGFFDIVGKISSFISDIEGDKTISYTLTLPISSKMVFLHIGISWAIRSALVSFFLFPMGKLILFNQFDLSKISFIRLIPIFITFNLFYGIFGMWLTSMLKKIGQLGLLWVRVINPLIMFGAYFYSWEAAYQTSPTAAFITLINPLVYAMEGMRASILGQEGFLPYWICLLALWGFIVTLGWHGITRLQKRLDCVR